MLRTQKKVTNRKKPQSTSSSTVNKSKGTKFDNNIDKVDSNAVHIIKRGKTDEQNIQGHHNNNNQISDRAKSPLTTKNAHPPGASFKLGDKKLERSNSFFLTRKLSKLYDSLTHSGESHKETHDGSARAATTAPSAAAAAVVTDANKTNTPFKFIRSVSLATISLKKDYRNSMRKPRLEQLSEEDQSMHAPLSNAKRKKDRKKSSTASMDSLSSEKSSIMSTFKRTFSLTPSRRKSANPKWSASLMNLQQIDVMISYEDLSFIDYDKFNTYEENLMTKIKSSNQIDVNRSNAADQFPGVKMRSHANTTLRQQNQQQPQQRRHSTIVQRSSMQANDEYTTENWLNGNSKRWSNPCIGPNTDCISAFPFVSSCASVAASRSGKVHPAIDCDECDYGGSKPQSFEMPGNSRNPAHSVDDLMNTVNEHEHNQGNPDDLQLLQMVSESICSFRILFL